MRLLAVVNSEASRVEAALTEVAAWFEENCEAIFLTTRSQNELREALLRHGPAADRIVIGGGDGTISNALPELLQLDKPFAVLPLGTANDFRQGLGVASGQPRRRGGRAARSHPQGRCRFHQWQAISQRSKCWGSREG